MTFFSSPYRLSQKVTWKDGDNYIHKRELCKSGEWCPYCWGPAHEQGFKCIYYNFCKYYLSFQPLDREFRDFKMKSHICNYGITENDAETKGEAPPQSSKTA